MKSGEEQEGGGEEPHLEYFFASLFFVEAKRESNGEFRRGKKTPLLSFPASGRKKHKFGNTS